MKSNVEINNKKELYRVPITWQETGTVYVRASSPEDAIKIAEQNQTFDSYGNLVKGSVKVIESEKVISDREYRRSDGTGPKCHLITEHSIGKIHAYLEAVRNQAAENKTITSIIDGFTNIPEEGFNKERLQTLFIDICKSREKVIKGLSPITSKGLYSLKNKGFEF